MASTLWGLFFIFYERNKNNFYLNKNEMESISFLKYADQINSLE